MNVTQPTDFLEHRAQLSIIFQEKPWDFGKIFYF